MYISRRSLRLLVRLLPVLGVKRLPKWGAPAAMGVLLFEVGLCMSSALQRRAQVAMRSRCPLLGEADASKESFDVMVARLN
jgi:hypothetical protein